MPLRATVPPLPSKRTLIGLLTLVVSVTVTATALEGILRARASRGRAGSAGPAAVPESLGEREIYRPSDDPVLGYELAPGARATTASGVKIAINARGFRGPEVEATPTPGVERIVMLGGSEVFGEKLAFADTLPQALEVALASRTGRRAEVLNLGVVGYTTARAIHLHRVRARALGARTVILHPTTFDALAPSEVASQDGWDRSYLIRTAREFAMMWRAGELLASPEAYARFVDERFRAGGVARAALGAAATAFARDLDAEGARLVVIVSPELFGLTTREQLQRTPYRAFHDAVGDLASRGLAVIDPLAALVSCATSPTELWVAAEDHHRNARANRCIAEEVAAADTFAVQPP